MCWSATADLVAGTCIAAVGAACVARVRRIPDLPLAALPLLLGAHQIIESVIWRLGGDTGPATLAWAVIALPLLPLWVPLGVLCAAPPHARRRLLVPLAAGIATAVPLAYCLATRPVTAKIRGHTLGYVLDLPAPGCSSAGTSWPRWDHCYWPGTACCEGSGCWSRSGPPSVRRFGGSSSSRPGVPSRRCAR